MVNANMNHTNDIQIDHDRFGRLGFPEIVYGEYKSAEQVDRLLTEHVDRRADLLITRLDVGKVPQEARGGQYDSVARTFTLRHGPAQTVPGTVAVVSAGTSDRPVVAEILNTLEFLGVSGSCFQDVGIAGLHRLSSCLGDIAHHSVIIVVAGFEGALPSVVAGLLPQPVIAVPTSIGYGVAAGGHAALNAMLASCANGVVVTNIDNGCGAALAARRFLGLVVHRG
jgi:NCAIR mutase (PurE)-related protein